MNAEPAAWVLAHASLLPSSGTALDVACGRGRHALWLASRALTVTAIDRDISAIAELRRQSNALGLHVDARVDDLETGGRPLEPNAFDAIVVVHYLHRALFPSLLTALRPNGLLVYETFTRAQAALGKPSNPAFLLEPGELARLVQPLEILDSREGFFDARHLASVVARKPPYTKKPGLG